MTAIRKLYRRVLSVWVCSNCMRPEPYCSPPGC